jgi:hypothetical protein
MNCPATSLRSLSAVRLAPRWIKLFLIAFFCLATLGLYAYSLWWPVVMYDDFPILLRSWTWNDTWNNLWLPNNEHAMPLGRISTWLFIHIAGPLTRVPFFVGLQGPLALVMSLALVYLFVTRELGHPWYGLVATAFFGITSVYEQAVNWFASSFSVLALVMLLLALLAAQSWRQSGRWLSLVALIVCCALAPAWFASGILAGPVCCLYLFGTRSPGSFSSIRLLVRRACEWTSPLLGTLLFLAISLPRTKDAIMHTPHYGEVTAIEAFSLEKGLIYTGRSLIDNLALGVFGINGVMLPVAVIVVALTVLAAAAGWWWYKTPKRGLLLLGLGMILSHYLLFYGARSLWPYGVMVTPTWSRYHLVPQLGLTFFLVGGLTRWQTWWRLQANGKLTWKQVGVLMSFALILFAVQFPRSLFVRWRFTLLSDGVSIKWQWPVNHLEQQAAFRHIEEVDEICRRHGIKAEMAREVLPEFHVPLEDDQENNWQFLRGADSGPFKTEEEAREIFEKELK